MILYMMTILKRCAPPDRGIENSISVNIICPVYHVFMRINSIACQYNYRTFELFSQIYLHLNLRKYRNRIVFHRRWLKQVFVQDINRKNGFVNSSYHQREAIFQFVLHNGLSFTCFIHLPSVSPFLISPVSVRTPGSEYPRRNAHFPVKFAIFKSQFLHRERHTSFVRAPRL